MEFWGCIYRSKIVFNKRCSPQQQIRMKEFSLYTLRRHFRNQLRVKHTNNFPTRFDCTSQTIYFSSSAAHLCRSSNARVWHTHTNSRNKSSSPIDRALAAGPLPIWYRIGRRNIGAGEENALPIKLEFQMLQTTHTHTRLTCRMHEAPIKAIS